MVAAAVPAVPTRRPRVATPARWQSALRRGLDNGVQIFQLAGSGQWIATSTSKLGTAYETDGVTCTCEAALLGNDPVCQHRAIYWCEMGALSPEDPEPGPGGCPPAPALALVPAPPANVVPLHRCQTCQDTGRVVKPSAFFPGQTVEGFCPACVDHFDFATRTFRKPAA